MNPPPSRDEAQIRAYHHRTKHAFGRYAVGPDFMDWDSQPDPFRRFEGAPKTALTLNPSPGGRGTCLYADLFEPGKVSPVALDAEGVGVLLELSFGLSAWKQYGGDRWALRCNPSSGNLHPTEAYVVACGVAGLDDGAHHYLSLDHSLELRCRFAPPAPGLWLGLGSVHWREAWKYGERAFRYCQHDIGHALGALRYAAAALGWRVTLLDGWGDGDIAALLGLDRVEDFAKAEPEAPDLLCRIETGADALEPDIATFLQAVRAGQWQGRANRLSPRHEFDWPVIEEAHAATRKPRSVNSGGFIHPPLPAIAPTVCELPAAALIKQRRSAQAFDGVTSIPAQTLFRILDASLPRPDLPPFDAWNWPPRVHLLLFLHRVQGLPPGLYLFCRGAEAEPMLREAVKVEFDWEPVVCPAHLRLFRLKRANARPAAKALCCHQDIAADSAFSLGMLAEFDAGLAAGPWGYRRLFWECGLVGQALYLEAEAAGLRGTGIGCFFDDAVHDLLGLQGSTLQSLYHFTIGGPVVDTRLLTLPGYAERGTQEAV